MLPLPQNQALKLCLRPPELQVAEALLEAGADAFLRNSEELSQFAWSCGIEWTLWKPSSPLPATLSGRSALHCMSRPPGVRLEAPKGLEALQNMHLQPR